MKLLISNIKNEKAILKNSEYENILSKSELERVRKFSSQKRKNEFISFFKIVLYNITIYWKIVLLIDTE